MVDGAGWGRGRPRQGQLVGKVRVGPVEVEGDCAYRVVDDDPRRQITPPRVPGAGWGADDALEVVGVFTEADLALEAGAEVGRLHERTVGVADALAERERVRGAAVGGPGQSHGQVRYQGLSLRAARSAESEQTVVDP